MLVDKTDVADAKEKLGDGNAFIIADLLGLEEFDEKDLKACCPYHNEDTASFIYNKKNYTFHCFGCSKTVDIIDVYMETQNATFLEAVQWLFEKVGMEFSCPEQHVKTIPRYKYPHEESLDNDRTVVYEYLKKREISKATADYLDIRADKNGNIAFLTYDQNDTLSVVNYRKSRKINHGENKCWFQKDADAADLLWNMNRVNNTKPLVITEGQIDCASVVQAGYLNCVSVLKGSQGMGWIEYCWDWLQQFDSIIIFSDGDAPGIKMRNEVINRLGAMRCKYVEIPKELEYKDTGKLFPVKDASEILQCKGEKYLLELINTAKDIPITSVAKLSEIKELNPTQMDGFELCATIKNNAEFSHIPVILLTAKTNVQSKVTGLESGADAYIEKPFSLEHLVAQISNLLNNRRKIREAFANSPLVHTGSIALTKSDEQFLNKLTEMVQMNISNADFNFNIDHLAEEFCMSRSSFLRKIKGITGVTPNDFIRLIRLKKAAEILQEGEYKVNEVCYLVGFSSTSYFTKAFQKQFGILPRDFVKKLRGEE